jgi:serine/threonine protein kinase
MNTLEELTNALFRGGDETQWSSSHCKLDTGDIVGSYQVCDLVGQGRFAKVYSAINKNNGMQAAIKVYREGGDNAEYYENEIKILNKLLKYTVDNKIEPPNVIRYLGALAHVAFKHDLSPGIYPSVVFSLEGDSLSKLLRHCKKTYDGALPIPMVKKIARDILGGLEFLHKCGIIHTDIKPGNILLDRKIADINNDSNGTFKVSLADLGSSTVEDDLFSMHVGTAGYCAPELLLEQKYTSSIDVWAAFVTIYELITGDLLFDVYNECDIDYGDATDPSDNLLEYESDSNCSDTDRSDSNCSESDRDTLGNGSDDSCGSEYDSDSSGSEDEDLTEANYRNLLLIEKIIGSPPKKFTKNGRDYYNSKGKLKNNPVIKKTSISKLLSINYELDDISCKSIEEFLINGFKYLPEQRISARGALDHPFLN